VVSTTALLTDDIGGTKWSVIAETTIPWLMECGTEIMPNTA
jgi:hypothetical protein